MATPASTAAPSSAKETPAASAPPPEDAAGDGGEAIDTFSSYVMPKASLPKCLLNALTERVTQATLSAEKTNDSSLNASVVNNSAQGDTSTMSPSLGEEQEVIEIVDTSNSSFPARAAAAASSSNAVIDLCESDTSNHATEEDTVMTDSNDKVLEATTTTSDMEEHDASILSKIPSHTSPACESALLSSVSAPRAPEQTGETLVELAKNGALSPLQLEGVSLAIARHNCLLVEQPPSNRTIRAGFFLGDGAGVGKGRQIAAVLRDSLCRGRTRHLWVSVSRELCLDAKRDLQDVNCHVSVHDGSELLNQTGGTSAKGLGAGGSLGKGVLFVTYPLLISGKGKRMEEIINWLSGDSSSTAIKSTTQKTTDRQSRKENAEHSFSGVIVFDECHRAKNLDAGTQTAKLVMELQARLPHARVLYCSATGVSDLKHMVYATRLGLWGAGNVLYPTFASFQGALSNRGVGSLEMLALEMKLEGTFVARTLAWDGAEFETMEVKLRGQQIVQYDAAVQWWHDTKRNIEAALAHMGVSAPTTLWRAYWSAQQRFFKELCICAKLHDVVEKAQQYLDEGCAIVIGLQSTGESGTQCALEELEEQLVSEAGGNASFRRSSSGRMDFEDIRLSSLVSTAQSIMTSFVRNHFPIAPPPQEAPKVPTMPPEGFNSEEERLQHMHWQAEAERIKNLPPPEPVAELVELRKIVLGSCKELVLPPSPLDDLIDRLGGVDQVAEMTGRSGRIVRNGENEYKFVKRLGVPTKQKYGLSMPTSSEDADRLNIVEKRKFMEGKKSVAIISDAASTGISLHAAENSGAAHKRRVHFTIELPWAADKAIQQLGRSHRSGQRSAPIYQMVVTELGGERRFAAAVSKRMASLGALTKGDRRAATGSDLSDFDIDSLFGRRALKRVYTSLRSIPPSVPSRNSNTILDEYIRAAAAGDEAIEVPNQEEDAQRAYALGAAAEALEYVGLTGEADVKVFLNRIMGLAVKKQNLVFSLFMSSLDDVVTDAKATGEFEGSVEDVKATSITMKEAPAKIAVDKSSGAATMLTKITLDRGISFEQVVGSIVDGKKASDVVDTGETETNQYVADSGFYVSKRKIAGRHLIMFAKRKIDQDDISEEFASVVDPLGLMIITRPNTGKNPCEMSSRDLRIKYDKLITSRELIHMLGNEDTEGEGETSSSEKSVEDAVDVIRKKQSRLARLWDDAYAESNYAEHHMGLAPRISHMGLVTGAVLHVLPALEKATQFMSTSQKALKVMRVELTDSGQRLVGIKFPLEEEATGKLFKILAELSVTATGASSGAVSSRNESFTPVDAKSAAWATTERKTMRSFFAAKTPNATSGAKRKVPPSSSSITPTPLTKKVAKKSASQAKNSVATKTKTAISSFFTKK